MNFSKPLLTGTLACLMISAIPASATEHAHGGASKSEAVGVGTGALIGGAVGGPVGAILGAALGGHYGDTRHQAKTYKTEAQEVHADLKRSRNRLNRALTEQEQLDQELLVAQDELAALNAKIDQLFVERALVDGLQFDVHFDTDEVELGEGDQARLRRLSQLLNAVPEAEVELHGFADARGAVEYNEVLSLDRAYTVAETLSALGVSREQIKTFAQGESQALAQGGNLDAYAHDRRVSIQLQLPVTAPAVVLSREVSDGVKTAASGQ